ncbi:MAG: hypothetical protein U0326_31545 [Polyangiales bacterium]
MTAVAVWDHRPTDAELLDARLASGWEPTPTATRDGAKVLGYAACAVKPTPAR